VLTAHSGTQLAAVYDTPNTVLDIILNNLDDGDHPFHLHGHKPFLVGAGSGQYDGQPLGGGANPMRRDTVLVPAYHWAALRVVLDHAGYWACTCPGSSSSACARC
jgi:FtsP/CotA-like multicopper oxidase with cupredoxin domain